MSTGYKPETLLIHAGYEPDPTTGSVAVPIHQTTSYRFQNTDHAADLFALKQFGNIYTRIMNPTTAVLENRIAALEGGTGALCVASGQSATTLALFNILHSGDEFIASADLYGGTYTLFSNTFPKMCMQAHFVDQRDPENFRKALKEFPNSKAIFAETVGNPRLDTLDIEAVAAVAHEHGVPLIVDNTVPSPYLMNPIAHGADVVVASMTKFIGGHGTSIGGVIVDGGTFNWGNGKFPNMTEPDASYHGLKFWDTFGDLPGMGNVAFILKARVHLLRDLGPALSPHSAFLFLQGLETLHLRMERHSANALAVAKALSVNPAVEWVNYPGLEDHPTHELARKYFHRRLYSALIGFGIKGGRDAGRKLIDNVKLFSHLANIGDSKSLVIHPATTTHQQLTPAEQKASGVSDDYVRLSIGTEHVDDIIADLEQAIAASQA